ncbi:MAG TPA: prepilin-type N-terminal cleavage/methylation domain-containing protein [Acidobacteriota bacterium]|nr:prepilin-type N-terminal cleavage/methylation domain-containing protein [Acidobacteriota bacterium]
MTRLVDLYKRRRDSGCQPFPADGFTLIEVVLALTIFALMGAILYGAFSLGQRAVEKADVNSTRNQKQRAMADLLGNYVRSGYPYRESAQDQTIYFVGEIDSVSFVSAYSQALGGRGMAKIQITKQDDGNGRASLTLEETAPVRINSEAGASGQSHSIVLQSDLREFRLAYLDPQAEDESWEDRWDGAERRQLPRAVRFSYLNDAGKEVSWVFPIMMTVLAQ